MLVPGGGPLKRTPGPVDPLPLVDGENFVIDARESSGNPAVSLNALAGRFRGPPLTSASDGTY